MRTRQSVESALTVVLIIGAWLWLGGSGATYYRSLTSLVAIYYLLAFSLNIVLGFTDLISFGQAAFFGVGAYASVIVAVELGAGLLGGMAVGVALSVVLALAVAGASARLSGVYFALATLAAAQMVYIVILNWVGLTRGPLGLSLPGTARTLAGSDQVDRELLFSVVMATALLATIGLFLFLRSDAGHRMVSVRENPDLAASIGVRPLQQRSLAFAASGAVASIGGSLYAFNYGILTPDVSALHYSALALLIVIFGGKGTILGPLIGAIAFVVIPEAIGLSGTLGEVAFAAVLLVIVLLLPKGVIGSVYGFTWRRPSWLFGRPSGTDPALRGSP